MEIKFVVIENNIICVGEFDSYDEAEQHISHIAHTTPYKNYVYEIKKIYRHNRA